MTHYCVWDGAVSELTFPKLPFPITVISPKLIMLKGPYTIQWGKTSAGGSHWDAVMCSHRNLMGPGQLS